MSKWKLFGLCAALAGTISLVGAGVVTSAEMAQDTVQEAEEQATELGATEETEPEEMSVKDVVAVAMPSMVSITNTSVKNVRDYYGGNYDIFGDLFGDFFGYGYGPGYGYGYGPYGNGGDDTRETVSRGSGVIVGETDDALLIATNAHVVSDATELSVAFFDETVASATIVGTDVDNDLALIKVFKQDMEDGTFDNVAIVALGTSEDLMVGEQVVAIGNALGYGQSASTGIISAKNRQVTTYNESTGTPETTDGMLQTDAAINPGNSGGALLNMKGELIGINSAKFSSTDVEGMGYAIPIDKAEPILTDIANGKVPTDTESSSIEEGSGNAFLGITCVTISEDYANAYNIPTGAYVNSINPGSAAEKAGIREGDIITAVDGKEVHSATDLKNLISHYSEGDSAELTVVCFSMNRGQENGSNNYRTTTVNVTFGTQETNEEA